MPTVRQIAQAAGVSKSTVSLVLNGKPGVSDDMRNLVLSAVNQLESDEGATAERKDGQQTNMPKWTKDGTAPLSIVVSHPPILRSSQVFSEILHGIQTAATRHGVQLRLVAYDPHAYSQQVVHLYLSDSNLRPDGLLIFGGHPSEPLIEEAEKHGLPYIMLSRQMSDTPRSGHQISGLSRDEQRCAREATNYLLKLGHHAIAFVGGDHDYGYVKSRLAGYRQALQAADLPVKDEWVALGHGQAAAAQLLDQAPEVTAVLFVNDTYAAEGLPVLKAAGLSIPQDISIISFDDTDIARHHNPPLTSIAYNRFEEGQWAVKALIEQIRFPFIESYQITFKADFITRNSCAPPRAS